MKDFSALARVGSPSHGMRGGAGKGVNYAREFGRRLESSQCLGAGLKFLLLIAACARRGLFMDSNLPTPLPPAAAAVPAPRSIPIADRSRPINTGSRTPSCPSWWWCRGVMYGIRGGLIHTSCAHLAERAVTKK